MTVVNMRQVTRLVVKRKSGETLAVAGRLAWTLERLMLAGKKGCTPIEQPAPRWSDYVFKLRLQGIPIATVREKHGGTYAGEHARYVLAEELEVLERVAA